LTKGIQKQKRSRMVWDETRKEWLPRFGKDSIKNKNIEDQWVIEHNDNIDPQFEDPFEEKMAKRKEAIGKQKKREERNNIATTKNLPSTVSLTSDANAGKDRVKLDIDHALYLSKTSTASVGVFDKPISDDPTDKRKSKKRKFEPTIEKDFSAEKK